jgi:ribosome biogenesis GTPase
VASPATGAYPRRVTEPRVQLADLGWEESWQEALSAAASTALDEALPTGMPGRVARVDRGMCTVLTAAGPVRATLGGDVLQALAADANAAPCTGDWALVRQWPDGPVTIEALAPRRTSLIRAEAYKGSRAQVLAANVDVVAAVVALHPEPNLGRIERLLAVAWESGATPAVVLTKADLVVDSDEIAEDVRAAAPGVTVVCCSTETGRGLPQVRGLLSGGRTMVLVGASGHGKSTLTNALVGADVLTTRQIRDDGRGRHTSVRRELLLVPGGGALIDTPGLRGVGLQRDGGSLGAAFPDVESLTEACRFGNCRHVGEPGCAVLEAVASGELPVRRHESWLKLRRELDRAEARVAARMRSSGPRPSGRVTYWSH